MKEVNFWLLDEQMKSGDTMVSLASGQKYILVQCVSLVLVCNGMRPDAIAMIGGPESDACVIAKGEMFEYSWMIVRSLVILILAPISDCGHIVILSLGCMTLIARTVRIRCKSGSSLSSGDDVVCHV